MLGGARRFAAVAALPAAIAAAAEPASASSGGRAGRSGRQGPTCNECHSGGVAPDVAFVLPQVVHAGESVTVRFTVHAGSSTGKAAGFNVAAEAGTLMTIPGQSTHLSAGELTHNEPRENDDGRNAGWNFTWVAPATPGRYRLWGAGNSVNLNGQSSGDRSAAVVLRLDVVAAEPSATPTATAAPPTVPPAATHTLPPTATPASTATSVPTASASPTATAPPTHTATAPPTETATSLPTSTASATASAPAEHTPTTTSAPATPSDTPTASPSPARSPFCPGDCNGDGGVTINELVLAVTIALETQPLAACPESDLDGDRRVAINELIALVNLATSAC